MAKQQLHGEKGRELQKLNLVRFWMGPNWVGPRALVNPTSIPCAPLDHEMQPMSPSMISVAHDLGSFVGAQVCNMDVFLLTVGSFLPTIEFFYLQLCLGASFLTIGAVHFQKELFCLQLRLLCLQWECMSNKHLNGL